MPVSADAEVRRLKAEDAASFKAIRLEALTANPQLIGSTFELENGLEVAWFARRLEDAHVLGAFRTGELVGTAGLSIQQGQTNAHKGRVFGMYVRPGWRKRGFGRLLLNTLLEVAREHVELVQLTVVRDNQPARRLYESVGLVEFGMERKASKYGHQYYDEAHMVLDFSHVAEIR